MTSPGAPGKSGPCLLWPPGEQRQSYRRGQHGISPCPQGGVWVPPSLFRARTSLKGGSWPSPRVGTGQGPCPPSLAHMAHSPEAAPQCENMESLAPAGRERAPLCPGAAPSPHSQGLALHRVHGQQGRRGACLRGYHLVQMKSAQPDGGGLPRTQGGTMPDVPVPLAVPEAGRKKSDRSCVQAS